MDYGYGLFDVIYSKGDGTEGPERSFIDNGV